MGPSHNKLSHPGSGAAFEKSRWSKLSLHRGTLSQSLHSEDCTELGAQEGNCEWSFKAPGLGTSLGT